MCRISFETYDKWIFLMRMYSSFKDAPRIVLLPSWGFERPGRALPVCEFMAEAGLARCGWVVPNGTCPTLDRVHTCQCGALIFPVACSFEQTRFLNLSDARDRPPRF